MSCGPSHCLIVTRGGSLWAWGSGTLGQVCFSLTTRLLIEHLIFERRLQLGFGESIQQQVGPWKLSLPGMSQ